MAAEPSFLRLGDDVLLNIFELLPSEEILALRKVCQLLRVTFLDAKSKRRAVNICLVFLSLGTSGASSFGGTLYSLARLFHGTRKPSSSSLHEDSSR